MLTESLSQLRGAFVHLGGPRATLVLPVNVPVPALSLTFLLEEEGEIGHGHGHVYGHGKSELTAVGRHVGSLGLEHLAR